MKSTIALACAMLAAVGCATWTPKPGPGETIVYSPMAAGKEWTHTKVTGGVMATDMRRGVIFVISRVSPDPAPFPMAVLRTADSLEDNGFIVERAVIGKSGKTAIIDAADLGKTKTLKAIVWRHPSDHPDATLVLIGIYPSKDKDVHEPEFDAFVRSVRIAHGPPLSK